MVTEDKCASFLGYYKAGFQINVQLSNLANLSEVDLEEKLHHWALNSSTSPNCTFVLVTEDKCAAFIHYYESGFSINRERSNFTELTPVYDPIDPKTEICPTIPFPSQNPTKYWKI